MVKIYSVRIAIGLIILITGLLSPGILIIALIIQRPLFKLIADSLRNWHNKAVSNYIFAPVSNDIAPIVGFSSAMTIRAAWIAFRNGIKKIIEYDKATNDLKQVNLSSKDKNPVNRIKQPKKRVMKTTKELLRQQEYSQN
jgi:hypothetical protein